MIFGVFQQFPHIVRSAEYRVAAHLRFVVVDEAGHLPLEVAETATVIFDAGSDHAAVALAADDDYFLIHNKL